MNRLVCGMLLCLVGPAQVSSGAETPFDEARSVLEKWVETRQLIGREKTDWQVEKETLTDSIRLIEKEIKVIDEQIAKAEAVSTQADKERQQLLEENAALTQAAAVVRNVIGDLEAHLVRLAKAFPEPLKEKIQPLFRRIPQSAGAERVSLSERMQNIVGILNEVDKFNGAITVVAELRKNPAGADVQVTTLYLGLAQAFFVDRAGQYAGVGTPAAEGWQWTARQELAPRITRAIAIYNNTQPAAFIPVPVQIK